MYVLLHLRTLVKRSNVIHHKRFVGSRLLAKKPYFEAYYLAITIIFLTKLDSVGNKTLLNAVFIWPGPVTLPE